MIKVFRLATPLAAIFTAAGMGVITRHAPEPGTAIRPEAASPAPPGADDPKPAPRYVVQPPDVLRLAVLQAMPGRPLDGEFLVRPDGTISLGYYGELPAAGLTLPEVKARLVEHLRRFVKDEALGLIDEDPDNGRQTRVAPADSRAVSVEVAQYNSQVYYVEGEVSSPARLPITGGERVLDAIHLAGGLAPGADPGDIRLIRPDRPGEPGRVLRVDYEEITTSTDPRTNYALQPGDRLVIGAGPRHAAPTAPTADLPGLERRLEGVEKKLDQVLEELRAARARPRR